MLIERLKKAGVRFEAGMILPLEDAAGEFEQLLELIFPKSGWPVDGVQ